jgi:zinc transport system ATP-binding protein
MTQPILKLDGIGMQYDTKCVLKDVSLQVNEHDFLGIIGPNGGGKTTLMRIILGLLRPTEGTMHFFRNGEEVKNLRMGYLPQYSRIDRSFPISVREVVLSGLNCDKHWWQRFTKEQKQQVETVIQRVGMDGWQDTHIGALSGGQLQRVLLGRAIVSSPELLILDEPNTYLDKSFEAHLYRLLEEINRECTIIMVNHDIGTTLQNVTSVACVNGTLDYHPNSEVSAEWLERHFNCPIELIGHGNIPHRILKCHCHDGKPTVETKKWC